ncbi:TRAP-type C4-dicarboxylate transport system, small permease component [Caldanaerovirga acetigignens]|uniref:TRAP-type C4-dicarboxylate transport system, small permease component n=1 Tax=Caldanaerovirga acetigignens TaxID=447595 RepID=A0A1M7GJY5_9FIRM|nr:TRAP transporter small permease [Caldanaerovirga acetigignens]SHM16496.1 TRAP-type C4-dicarboxylate transport system, small permease component [Caldanaerovirga acetigignens]
MNNKFDRILNSIVETISMSLLVLMTLIVSWVVFSRYFLHKTPAWGEEASLLCMVWFGFLSMAIGVRDNLHLSITILDQFLSAGVLKILDWIKRVMIFGFSIFMIKEGIKMSQVATGNYMPGLKLNSAFLYAVIPISGIAMIYYVLTEAIAELKRKGVV